MAPRQDDDEISVADDMLRSGYERWHRLEEEKAAIGEDLKELFAELKANGFAPKALRESFRRVRNVDDASQQEHDAIVDLYVASLTGARPARTREGEDDHPDHDAETGEIIETEPSGNSGEFPTPAQTVPSVPAERQLESTEVAPSASAAEAEEANNPVSSAPIQPETATERLDDLGSVQDGRKMSMDGQGNVSLEDVTAGETAPMQDGLGPVEAHNLEQAGSTPAPATSSLTGSAADKSAGGGISPAPAAPTKLKMNTEFFEEAHPACQRPKFCGGNSNIALCPECKAAAGLGAQTDIEPRESLH